MDDETRRLYIDIQKNGRKAYCNKIKEMNHYLKKDVFSPKWRKNLKLSKKDYQRSINRIDKLTKEHENTLKRP